MVGMIAAKHELQNGGGGGGGGELRSGRGEAELGKNKSS